MHIMIDLETMGNRPNAPIVAIGAVAFEKHGTLDLFYTTVSLESAVAAGGVMSPSTVLWWLRQSDMARGDMFDAKTPIQDALHEFSEFVERFASESPGVWGNGASFDNVILAETYRRFGLEEPWAFWQDRCYRTVKNMYPDVKMERLGVHHNAQADALSQARHLIEINRKHGDFL